MKNPAVSAKTLLTIDRVGDDLQLEMHDKIALRKQLHSAVVIQIDLDDDGNVFLALVKCRHPLITPTEWSAPCEDKKILLKAKV